MHLKLFFTVDFSIDHTAISLVELIRFTASLPCIWCFTASEARGQASLKGVTEHEQLYSYKAGRWEYVFKEHLLKTVMILVKLHLRPPDVVRLFGEDVPRQLRHRLKVRSNNLSSRRAASKPVGWGKPTRG